MLEEGSGAVCCTSYLPLDGCQPPCIPLVLDLDSILTCRAFWHAQGAKEKLENRQRADAKLRKEASRSAGA